jgi:putative ABC transport system permease protein
VAGVLGLLALVAGDSVLRLLGGIVVVVVAAAFLRGRVPERVHASLTGLVLAVWAFAMVAATSNEADPGVFFAVFTLAVLAAVFGLSILASANLWLVERGAGLLGGLSRGLRPTLRPPLAYLARRPLRTGITAGVFGVILAILALFSVFLALFRPQFARDSVGYDVRALSTGHAHVRLPASAEALLARETALPTRGYVGPLKTVGFESGTIFLPMFELSPSQFGSPPARLNAKDERFDSDGQVWTWVRDHPGWVISTFGNPGSTVELQGDRGPVTLHVAATQQQGILDGIIGSPAALAPFNGGSLGETLLLDAKPGVRAEHLATMVERSLFSEGVDAATTRSLLEKSYRANRTFFSVIQILMQMGLVVGILALGIVSLRAVVERRHVIGVLRAIGYRRRNVMGGLMAEAGVAASLGVVVGVAAGFVMGFIYWRQFGNGVPFGVDGPTLWSSLALVYGAVIVVTLGPAWRASRLPPAEAVRYTE